MRHCVCIHSFSLSCPLQLLQNVDKRQIFSFWSVNTPTFAHVKTNLRMHADQMPLTRVESQKFKDVDEAKETQCYADFKRFVEENLPAQGEEVEVSAGVDVDEDVQSDEDVLRISRFPRGYQHNKDNKDTDVPEKDKAVPANNKARVLTKDKDLGDFRVSLTINVDEKKLAARGLKKDARTAELLKQVRT